MKTMMKRTLAMMMAVSLSITPFSTVAFAAEETPADTGNTVTETTTPDPFPNSVRQEQSETVELTPGIVEKVNVENAEENTPEAEPAATEESTRSAKSPNTDAADTADASEETSDWENFYNEKTGNYDVTFNIGKDAEGDQVIELSQVVGALNAWGTQVANEEDPADIEFYQAMYPGRTLTMRTDNGEVFKLDVDTWTATTTMLPGDIIKFAVAIANNSQHIYSYKADSLTVMTEDRSGELTGEEKEAVGFDGQALPEKYQRDSVTLSSRSEAAAQLFQEAGVNFDPYFTRSFSYSDGEKIKNYLKNYYQEDEALSAATDSDRAVAYFLDYYKNPANGLVDEADDTDYQTISELVKAYPELMDTLYSTASNSLIQVNAASTSDVANAIVANTEAEGVTSQLTALKYYLTKLYEDAGKDASTMNKKASASLIRTQVGKDFGTGSDIYKKLSSTNYTSLVNIYNLINGDQAASQLLDNNGAKYVYSAEIDPNLHYDNFYNNLFNLKIGDQESVDDLIDTARDSWTYKGNDLSIGDYMAQKEAALAGNTINGAWAEANDFFKELLNGITSEDEGKEFAMAYNVDGWLTGNEYMNYAFDNYASITLEQMDGELIVNKVDEKGDLITTDEAEFQIWYEDENGASQYLKGIVDAEGKIKYSFSAEQSTVSTTGGILDVAYTLVKNLKYYVQEVKAPEGYNLDSNVKVIEVGDMGKTFTDAAGNLIQGMVINFENTVIVVPPTKKHTDPTPDPEPVPENVDIPEENPPLVGPEEDIPEDITPNDDEEIVDEEVPLADPDDEVIEDVTVPTTDTPAAKTPAKAPAKAAVQTNQNDGETILDEEVPLSLNPKTGDESNTELWLYLSMMALAGMVATAAMGFGLKRREDK